MRKRFLTLFVTMLCVLVFAKLEVHAAKIVENQTQADITWTYYDTGLLDLRQAYNPNTGNRLTFNKYKDKINEVVIQPGIEKIPYSTFTGFKKIRTVTMSNSVHEIGDFSGCVHLKTIILPNSVAKMGSFKNCISLENITLSTSLLTIGDFTDCRSLKSITIPLSAHEIGDFSGCTSLESIVIPNSVRIMNNFSGCTSLKSVNVSNSIVTLGDFTGCTSLKTINIPISVNYVGDFSGCTSLESITLPASVSRIGDHCFANCTSLKDITIPQSILDELKANGKIYQVFENTPWLLEYMEKEGGEDPYNGSAGDFTFSLEKNGNLTLSGSGTFGESGRTNITKFDGLVKTLIIQNDTTDFVIAAQGNRVPLLTDFFNGLEKVVNNSAVVIKLDSSDEYSWCDQNDKKKAIDSIGTGTAVIVRPKIKEQGDDPDYGVVKKKGTVIADPKTGCKYTVTSSNAKKPTVKFSGITGKKATTIDIPAAVEFKGVSYKITEVGKKALRKNKKVRKVKLGKNITKINTEAFYGCTALTSIELDANLTAIASKAFYGCSSLKTLKLPAKTTRLGKQFVGNCKKLKTITVKSTKLTKSTVSKNACSGIGKNVTIKVPKSKVSTYTKLFQSKGLGKKVKVQAGK